MTSQTTERPRALAEQQSRRTVRDIARHLAHATRDQPVHVLADLHRELGTTINKLANQKATQ